MSDHTEEKSFTKAEMREAWQEAADDTLSHTRPTFTAFMAALNKSTIHSGAPVIADCARRDEGETIVLKYNEMRDCDSNPRVLILIDIVKRWDLEFEKLVGRGEKGWAAMMDWKAAKIADYIRNGPKETT